MKEIYKIEKGTEIPIRTKYPFVEMEVGDSFLLKEETKKDGLYSWAKRLGIGIATRKEGEGFRVWRIK